MVVVTYVDLMSTYHHNVIDYLLLYLVLIFACLAPIRFEPMPFIILLIGEWAQKNGKIVLFLSPPVVATTTAAGSFIGLACVGGWSRGNECRPTSLRPVHRL